MVKDSVECLKDLGSLWGYCLATYVVALFGDLQTKLNQSGSVW